jgi:hypothetical protein
MRLEPECEAALMRAARMVADEDRDQFFEIVASQLRHLSFISLTDVRYASSAAIQAIKEAELAKRRAG